MQLKLILKGPDRLMGAQREKILANGSLVVGRSPSADWTLPDPERVVSKTHCRIDKDYGGFVLTDTSTNGVHVNEEPVGFGLPRLLNDGDVLKLGDAVVLVRIEDAAVQNQAPVKTAQAAPAPVAKPIPDGPFGIPEHAILPVESIAPAAAGDAGKTAADRILDDWWASEEPFGGFGNPISVDISAKPPAEAIPNTTSGEDPLPSPRGEVAKLVDSLAGIDLTAFARAVDMAAASALSEGERHRFQGRLRDLLVGDQLQRK